MAIVERESDELPLTVQTDLIGISHSGLYYHPLEPTTEEITVKHRIDEVYTQYPFYGSRRITAQLRREGVIINRRGVQRHMREMDIVTIYPAQT